MKPVLTTNDVVQCFALVVMAAPHLERTKDESWMQRLDDKAHLLLAAADYLEGCEYAKYAVALWPWCVERGHYGAAIDMLMYSQATFFEQISSRERVRACMGMGVLWQREQNSGQAETYLKIALRYCSVLKDNFLTGHAHHYLGLLYRRTGDFEKALTHHQTSFDIWSLTNEAWGMATAQDAMGVLHIKQDHLAAAHVCFSHARELYESLCDKKQTARVLNNLGMVAAQRGMLDHALNAFLQSGRIFREANDLNSLGLSLYNQGDICYEMRQDAKAQKLLIESLEIACRLEYTLYAHDAVNNLAFIAQRNGQLQQAAALLGASETLAQKRSVTLPADVQATYEICEAQVKSRLHPASRAALLRKGRRMSLSDIVAYIACEQR